LIDESEDGLEVIAIELQTPLEAWCAAEFSEKLQLSCDHGRPYPVIVGQFGEMDAFAACEPVRRWQHDQHGILYDQRSADSCGRLPRRAVIIKRQGEIKVAS
jgi:hypothetical protein